ncbi:hypothetical protein EDD18DRAFT_800939 [Armillaria luteobubalina]|uniref:Glycoside hydrolase family 76 protein n=1 Tax=Armillaria luteobubalina TaxID=153913 RepID=A0AA39PBL5_9AGAR|nr:hypothetical protein EDD18DRAFT_800939 [Armillaria luteobubalina]
MMLFVKISMVRCHVFKRVYADLVVSCLNFTAGFEHSENSICPAVRMRQFYIWTLFSVSWYSAVAAQDLQPPAAWRSPNITLSREDCINIARAALETAISNLNQSAQFGDNIYESPGRLYAQMAEFDRLTNQTKYKDMLKQYFLLAEFTRPGFLDLFYNLGCEVEYPDFLAFAVTAWTSARRYTISEDEDELGTMDTKQFTYPSSCQGETLTGGTYFASDPYNTNIASTSSGFFFVLSALLAKATSNNTYIDAAVESAHFIQSHLLNISNSVVLGSIEPSPNCAVDASNLVSDCAGSGLFIEGMVVLADIMAYNTSTIDLLRSTIVDVTSNSLWHEVPTVEVITSSRP